MDVSTSFSSSYKIARGKFLHAAQSMNALIESYELPLKGLEDEPLYTDIAWLGPRDAKKVLVTSSSTHGAEGFLGSGIQIAALTNGSYKNLPDSTAVLIIHAINPWGFSWIRRTNEDGVDLFRNFIDFTQTKPTSELYDKLVNFIVPRGVDALSRLKAELGLVYSFIRYGKNSLKAVIPQGQYNHPHAPFYGGVEPAWSNITLRKIIKEYLNATQQVVVIDYHTGLGKNGEGELIGFDKPGTEAFNQSKLCWGDVYVSVYSEDTTAYEIHGVLLNAYREELANCKLIMASYEFGTIDEKKVFKAMREDHWLYAYGDLHSEKAIDIRQNMKYAFYCDNNMWREKVLKQGLQQEGASLEFLDNDTKIGR